MPGGWTVEKKYPESVLRLQEKLQVRPNDRRALVDLFLALYKLKEYSEAAGHLTKAFELGEHSAELSNLLGKCFFRKYQSDRKPVGKI